MKFLKIILLLFLVFLSARAKSQSEYEIKSTGKYLYSWAYENSEPKAREAAKLGLLDTIFVSLLKESTIDKTDTIFIKVINYFVNKIGFKWQAIAFADKSDVKVKLEERKKLKVIPFVIGYPVNNSDNTQIIQTDTKTKNETNAVSPGAESDKGNKAALKTGNQILDDLLVVHDANLLETKLKSYKSALKLNYGNKSNYPDDSGCYVFVIDYKSLQVVAAYDKGTNSRRNLLTNIIDNNFNDTYKGNYFVYVVIN